MTRAIVNIDGVDYAITAYKSDNSISVFLRTPQQVVVGVYKDRVLSSMSVRGNLSKFSDRYTEKPNGDYSSHWDILATLDLGNTIPIINL